MKNKFIFNSATMIAALEFAKKAIVKNPVVPIIEGFLIEVRNGIATITGTTLQTTIRIRVKVETNKNAMPFAFTLPPVALPFMKKVELQPLAIEFNKETYSVLITGEEERAKYAGDNPEDFPIAPKTEIEILTLQPRHIEEFKDLINYTTKDELRPAMTAIHVGYREGKLNMVATDGHMLKVVNVPEMDEPGRDETLFNMPAPVAAILTGFKIEGPIKVLVGGTDAAYGFTNMSFHFESKGMQVELIARSIDERYPDYINVIPEAKETDTILTLEKKGFLKALDKAVMFANKTTHQVRLDVKRGETRLSAEDLDFSHEYNSKVPGIIEQGEGIAIGFNGKFLHKLFESNPEKVSLTMSAPNKAAVSKSGNSLVLVMPVMLAQYE